MISNRYVEGCWGFPYLEKLIGSLVSWFLGFKNLGVLVFGFLFLGFLVSKFIGLLVSKLFWFLGFNFPMIPY